MLDMDQCSGPYATDIHRTQRGGVRALARPLKVDRSAKRQCLLWVISAQSDKHVRFTPNNGRWTAGPSQHFGCAFMSTRPSARSCPHGLYFAVSFLGVVKWMLARHWGSLGSRLRLLQNAADTDPFGSIGSCRSKEIGRIISAVMGRDGLRHLASEVLR
jgi:hypothetical protein